jgi:hypothetical protein
MRKFSNASLGALAVALTIVLGTGSAGARPLMTPELQGSSDGVAVGGVITVGNRGYHDYDDEYYEHVPPSYYAPRVYGYVQRYGYGPPPPAVYPPLFFYDWGPPPRPTSCGKYRYWDGEACVDARFRPPYVGPRW